MSGRTELAHRAHHFNCYVAARTNCARASSGNQENSFLSPQSQASQPFDMSVSCQWSARHAAARRPARLGAPVPFGRQGTGREVAYATLFLMPHESSYVNAHALQVDGGLAAGIARGCTGRAVDRKGEARAVQGRGVQETSIGLDRSTNAAA